MQKQKKRQQQAWIQTSSYRCRDDKIKLEYIRYRDQSVRAAPIYVFVKKKNKSSRTTRGPSSEKCICSYSEKKEKRNREKGKKRAIALNVKNTKEKKRVLVVEQPVRKREKDKGEREEQEVYRRIL